MWVLVGCLSIIINPRMDLDECPLPIWYICSNFSIHSCPYTIVSADIMLICQLAMLTLAIMVFTLLSVTIIFKGGFSWLCKTWQIWASSFISMVESLCWFPRSVITVHVIVLFYDKCLTFMISAMVNIIKFCVYINLWLFYNTHIYYNSLSYGC